MSDPARIEKAFTTNHWRWFYLSSIDCPKTLLEALKEKLPHIEETSWPEKLAWGGVYVNGLQATEDCPLSTPCKIEYYEPRFDTAKAHEIYATFNKEYVIYRDDDIAIVFKPARLPSTPAKEQQHFNLKRSLEGLFGVTVHLPSRLDMSTAGLVIVSCNPDMHAPLQRLFEQRTIEKFYRLEVSPPISWEEQTLKARIGKDPKHAVLRRVVLSGGKEAVTLFNKLCDSSFIDAEGVKKSTSIIEAKPLTGRTHQIRVHASYLGAPIVGDNFYGGIEANALHLLSYRIALTHPASRARIDVAVPAELLPEWVKVCKV